MEELRKVKELLGVDTADTSKDALISFAIEEAAETICNYCNVDAVPAGLSSTHTRMAIDFYRGQNLGSEEDAQGAVQSVKEGDTAVAFSGTVEFKAGLLADYRAQLNRYRTVKWR